MNIIADLHLHSKYSRAVSKDMTIPNIAAWAAKKGIGLIATGDWTHPMWMSEIEKELEEDGSGILRLKSTNQPINKSTNNGEKNTQSPKFLLSTELSCIYSQGGKTRRVHTLVWVPTIAAAKKINQELTKRGCNLLSDGRPILGLTLIDLAELILTVEPNALIVPAQIWTPWFSVYGKMGGFESLEEAFGAHAKYIYAVETGLSSSPDMNWRIKELDTRAIVSFSDAHSGAKLGREATIFALPEVTYENIAKALKGVRVTGDELRVKNNEKKHNINSQPATRNLVTPSIVSTVEFYPEEGKYHYTGHRDCHVRLTPDEVVAKGTTCSVCGKQLTQGVMQRVAELATRTNDQLRIKNYELHTVNTIKSEELKNRPPFVMSVPLQEIIAEAIGSPVTSKKIQPIYHELLTHFGNEFAVLLTASLEEIAHVSRPQIADGIRKVRIGDIVVDPGFDGVFGVVKIWKNEKEKALVDSSKEQLSLM